MKRGWRCATGCGGRRQGASRRRCGESEGRPGRVTAAGERRSSSPRFEVRAESWHPTPSEWTWGNYQKPSASASLWYAASGGHFHFMALVLNWKVKEYLTKHGITPYRLMREAGLGQGTVYRLANNEADGVHKETLERVIRTLRRLTGEATQIDDLLIYERKKRPTPEEALLEGSTADLADMLDELESDLTQAERDEWLASFEKVGV